MGLLKAFGKRLTAFGGVVINKMDENNGTVNLVAKMVQSGAAFARQFRKNEAVLDEKILKCGRHRAVPRAWCTGRKSWFTDPCSQIHAQIVNSLTCTIFIYIILDYVVMICFTLINRPPNSYLYSLPTTISFRRDTHFIQEKE
ncbi:hypothetical protein POM88_031241 [Heracleum sosnowskyi]|uniref:Uncharacterized protein n=1 Tax=Heracleum sosnowskyi TaxID=360622 RepID=A0AAD8MK54_9APIA|nr:hypothetical protein POM88_031241 [Heracleum sosnowskyi]